MDSQDRPGGYPRTRTNIAGLGGSQFLRRPFRNRSNLYIVSMPADRRMIAESGSISLPSPRAYPDYQESALVMPANQATGTIVSRKIISMI